MRRRRATFNMRKASNFDAQREELQLHRRVYAYVPTGIINCGSIATMAHSSITMTYDVYGHLFHDPTKDVDLMDEMERGLMAA